MGFSLKLVFVNPIQEPVLLGDGDNILDEGQAIVWMPVSEFNIDLGRVTRLEKVTSERYKHLQHSSYKRAGICVLDCLFDILFSEAEGKRLSQVAPEIVMPFWMLDVPKTELSDGGVYLDVGAFHSDSFERSCLDKILMHNAAILQDKNSVLRCLEYHPVLSCLIRWVDCSEMASVLDKAESDRSEAWLAVEEDHVSLAIARGWREIFSALARTGTKCVFLFDW